MAKFHSEQTHRTIDRVKAWKWNHELRDQPLHLIAAQRIAARFGRAA